MCVLPTGYGKSLIYYLMPMLLFAKRKMDSGMQLKYWELTELSHELVNTIVIVVSPLNALIVNQISRLNRSGVQASVLSVTDRSNSFEEGIENIELDFSLCEEEKLQNGLYNIVFAHPELLSTKTYDENVVAIVIDEAHCMLDW